LYSSSNKNRIFFKHHCTCNGLRLSGTVCPFCELWGAEEQPKSLAIKDPNSERTFTA